MSDRLRFALLGHPVRHSISPAIQTAAFRALGLGHTYTAIDVASETALARSIEDLRTGYLHGVNVTIPFKRKALELADAVDPSAEEVGAANVLVRDRGRVVAHNTDAAGLAADLGALWAGRTKSRAIVIGAGGAGLAALVALKRLGFPVIGVTTRSWSSSEAMLEADSATRARALGALATLWPLEDKTVASGKASAVLRLQFGELAAGADCVVQATSLGMGASSNAPDALSQIVSWEKLAPHAFAYDVVYRPKVTPFIREARAHGLRAANGLGMLLHQAALSIRIWTGLEPSLAVMRAAADDMLDRGST